MSGFQRASTYMSILLFGFLELCFCAFSNLFWFCWGLLRCFPGSGWSLAIPRENCKPQNAQKAHSQGPWSEIQMGHKEFTQQPGIILHRIHQTSIGKTRIRRRSEKGDVWDYSPPFSRQGKTKAPHFDNSHNRRLRKLSLGGLPYRSPGLCSV